VSPPEQANDGDNDDCGGNDRTDDHADVHLNVAWEKQGSVIC